MTTTAQIGPYLEVSAAPDIMDMHSDSGLDFGDGDGDIDLEILSTGHVDHHDDDLSLHDVGTDLGLDVQTASADQDDFMADNDDLIEEDDMINYGDVEVDVDQPATNDPGAAQQEADNLPEEDLIDYSDEEDDAGWKVDDNVTNPADAPEEHTVPAEDAQIQPSVAQGPLKVVDSAAENSAAEESEDEIDYAQDFADGIGQSWNDEPGSYVSQSNIEQDVESHAEDERDDEDLQRPANESHADEHADALANKSDVDHETTIEHDEHEYKNVQDGHSVHEEQNQTQQEYHLHPVTVDFDGAELWLFKDHDIENSGDYLVEDSSLARRQICDLLDACRNALASDVTDALELGFRFDNFHNMELYQDHTACVFVTLQDLVNLYLQLNAQDGNTQPDSFYVTLIFRPRISALINDIRKAAAGEIGIYGLNNAIAAGQTAFTAAYAHNSPEHSGEWGNNEEEQESHEDVATGDLEGQEEQYLEEHKDKEQQESYDDDGEENPEEHNEEQQEENDSNEVEPQAQEQYHDHEQPASHTDAIDNAPSTAEKKTPRELSQEAENVAVTARETSTAPSHAGSAPATETNPEEEDDFIDYSDDEGPAEATQTNQTPSNQPSSSSSTVQGDDASHTEDDPQDLSEHIDLTQDGEERAYDADEGPADGTAAHYAGADPNDGHFDGQTYDEENDEGFPSIDDPEAYGERAFHSYMAQQYGENTNHYDNFDDQTGELTYDSTEAADLGFDGTTLGDTYEGANDLLDFEVEVAAANTVSKDQVEDFAEEEKFNYEDHIDYDDHIDYGGVGEGEYEDGPAGHAPVATSSAAKPVAASPVGLQNLSPQGQKRTIDEVSNDVGHATESTDAKRPRV